MADILAELVQAPDQDPLSLTGSIIVARDLAHSKIRARLEAGEPMPDYSRTTRLLRRPGQDAEGYASGSFGPTTAGRMDSYVDQFQAFGGSMVMLAKGNRSRSGARSLQGPMAASISARSAARRPAWRRTASRRSRSSNTRRTGHGSDLADRGRGLPGLHRHRRQGQRLLQGTEFRLKKEFGE
jgi:hypothetical protein